MKFNINRENESKLVLNIVKKMKVKLNGRMESQFDSHVACDG